MYFQIGRFRVANLVSKNENLQKSAPVVGAEILKILQTSQGGAVSIFDVARVLRKSNKVGPKSLYYGVIFLFTLGIIDFNEPYIVSNVNN
jgi:hypothetical protein